MKTWSIILACACSIALAQPLWSQKADEAKPGVLGYLDPATGVFRPIVPAQTLEDEIAPPVAATTGKLVYNFTFTIASTGLGTDTITCSANASVFEATSAFSGTETATVKATVKGTTATCSVTIPYSWALKAATTDSVSLSYQVLATPTAAGLPARISTQSLPTIKVPASGATTTETIASTI
jgi:hypothetical protein